MKKPINRKAEIIKTARNLFLTKEYDKVTMQQIIDKLGIAKGTLYHHFKSKESILEAVIEDIVQDNIKENQKRLERCEGNALEKIEELMKGGQIAEENNDLLEMIHRPGNDAMHSRLLAATLTKQAPLYAKLIEQGCDEGLFTTNHPLECAEFMLTAIQFLTDRGIFPWSESDLARRISAFPKLVERQLQAPDGSFHFLTELMKD